MNKKQLIKRVAIVLVVILGFILVLRMYTGGDKDFTGSVINNTTSTEGWKEYSNPENGISYLYPEDAGTKYIHVLDWPPTVNIYDKQFGCIENGNIIESNGETKLVNFGENKYCVTKQSEGAAGSTYTTYTYVAPYGIYKTLSFNFILQFIQCGNYDDPQKTECEAERASFDITPIVDKIFETI